MTFVVLIVGLEFPALVALVDCINRYPSDFEGGAEDRSAWLRWLVIALLLCPILFGYGILLGYYWTVVKRTSPVMHRGRRD